MGKEQPGWRELPILALIWGGSAAIDRLWFFLDHRIPAWDQAEYLTNALLYWHSLQSAQWFSLAWWTDFWQISTKLPPFVFIATAPFLSLFGTQTSADTWVNLLFSAILLGSVYGLGNALFNGRTGLWAALFCALIPGLYPIRLDYLLDYPLTALVTLSFTLLTLWQFHRDRPSFPGLGGWLSLALGVSLGITWLTKQSALLFLFVPLATAGIQALRRRQWSRVGQWTIALGLSITLAYPWYRTNWLLVLTGSKRATIDSALAEGDPSLLSLQAWTYYLKQLPEFLSPLILGLGILGLIAFWPRSAKGVSPSQPTPWRSLGWLLMFWLGAYGLSSLNINKDPRYGVPYLPVLTVILAYGWTLLPRRQIWQLAKASSLAVAGLMMAIGLFPIGSLQLPAQSLARHSLVPAQDWPHQQVIATITEADPFLTATVGVLPSTPEINQHNFTYYGLTQDFQVYGRQVGTLPKAAHQDARSLTWFLTKLGDQGSIRRKKAQAALTQQIVTSPDLTLHKAWNLPDHSQLQLYRRQQPLVEVRAQDNPAEVPISLTQVRVPAQVPPGQPVPITYEWVGQWDKLQSGLVLLTWQQINGSGRWLHDHAIAVGTLHLSPQPSSQSAQVIERLAMLPPATTPAGTYRLEATYLDRRSGQVMPLQIPEITLQITPTAKAVAAPELDLVTQLRELATQLPQGRKALDFVFNEVGRISQYDPIQDYQAQLATAMAYRWQQEPQNVAYAYAYGLATALQREVNTTIATFERIAQLDQQNPYAHAYLAFVNLYDFRARAAQPAIDRAKALAPDLPELQVLDGIAALMQGNLVKAWHSLPAYQQLD